MLIVTLSKEQRILLRNKNSVFCSHCVLDKEHVGNKEEEEQQY